MIAHFPLRVLRIADRVRVVGMAEDGASFLDVYRELVSEGEEPKEAYAITTRVFEEESWKAAHRSAKDACYLSGLVRVYNHLRGAIDGDPAHSRGCFVCWAHRPRRRGRASRIVRSRSSRFAATTAGWVTEREELAAYFAFTSFLSEIDLKS